MLNAIKDGHSFDLAYSMGMIYKNNQMYGCKYSDKIIDRVEYYLNQ